MGLTIRLLMMRATKAKRNFHKIDRAPSLTIRIRDEAVNHEDSWLNDNGRMEDYIINKRTDNK